MTGKGKELESGSGRSLVFLLIGQKLFIALLSMDVR